MNYLYKTAENPPTECFVALHDAVLDSIRSGLRNTCIVYRAEKASEPVYEAYCVTKAVQSGDRRLIQTQFMEE